MSEQRFINQMEPLYGEEEMKAVKEYLESGGWLMEFRKTRELENMIAKYVGAKYCALLPNGTLTLWAALSVLGIGDGDEVIVPDFTMVATANSVKLAGAKPIFVDINRDNLCLDIELTKKAITKRTKAIMLVSINGRCPQVKSFVELATEKSIYLIEDAAQSLGSTVNGKHLGTFGIFGSYSFSMPKLITMGQGGALVTDDMELYNRLLKFKDFGRSEGGSDNYEILGYNLKFTDIQAVLGIEQMKRLDNRIGRKKDIYNLYKKFLANNDNTEFIETSYGTVPWFHDILVPNPAKLAEYLKMHNIGTRRFYPTLHSLLFYNVQGNFPVSTYISDHGLWLPSSCKLSDEEINYICNTILSFYDIKV